MRIIIGLILVAIGALVVIKSEWFYQNFGSIAWAEAHLGTEGGSRLMYKLLGIIVIVIGFMVMTNLFGIFLRVILSPLFRGMAPGA